MGMFDDLGFTRRDGGADSDAFDAFVPATFDADPDADGETLHCEAGNHNWVYTGTATKRKPRNCPDHKTRASTGVSSRGTSPKKLEDLKLRLGVFVGTLGKGSSAMLPVTGTVLMANSAKAADAAVELARDNPRVLAILEKITLSVPAFDLGEVAAATLVAVAVDTKRMPPDTQVAQMLGVTEAWTHIYGPVPPREQKQSPKEPPAFVAIGA